MREILDKVLRMAKCNAIDDGNNIQIVSIDTLPDRVCTIDSRAFSSAVSLLKDLKTVNKTAYGLLAELEGKKLEQDPILLHADMPVCINNLFLKDFEVASILVDVNVRRIKFTWQRKTTNWKHINAGGGRSSGHIFVLKTDNDVKIEGLGENLSIVSGNCIFLVGDSPLLQFMRKLISNPKIIGDVVDNVADLVWQIFTEITSVDDQSINRLIQSEDGYWTDLLLEYFTREDLKKALKGCYETALDMRLYYNYV